MVKLSYKEELNSHCASALKEREHRALRVDSPGTGLKVRGSLHKVTLQGSAGPGGRAGQHQYRSKHWLVRGASIGQRPALTAPPGEPLQQPQRHVWVLIY